MEEKMQYDGVDIIGEQTLAAITSADQFNTWMYETIKPYVKGHLLEIGSGIGNISQYLLMDKVQLTLTDLRQNYCDLLAEKFKDQPTLERVLKVNLTHPRFEEEYADLLGKYDSIVALNVVEHIEDDNLAIANCYKLLSKGGHIIILVPAYQVLYNTFDTGLEHFRRYTGASLRGIISRANFEIIHSQYFNFAGIAGWILSGSILRKKAIPEGQMKLFNQLMPVIKIFDKIVFNKIGLSTICVGRKN